jgi:uncharacterized protein YeaO (DUF488 family)
VEIRIRRVYEKPQPGDGCRVLVDRLWPRGLKKSDARVDLWLRECAPSDALRRWYGHLPERWPEFKRRYFEELKGGVDPYGQIEQHCRGKVVTLLFGSRELQLNNAVALKEYLEQPGAAGR